MRKGKKFLSIIIIVLMILSTGFVITFEDGSELENLVKNIIKNKINTGLESN